MSSRCATFIGPSWLIQVFRDAEDQYQAFLYIMDQYMLPSSPHEFNLSGDMSKALLPFKTRYGLTVGHIQGGLFTLDFRIS